MPTTSFTQLDVWNRSVDVVCDIYEITSTFPSNERYGLVAQLRRASVSVPANIAEGLGRHTRGEYLNQLSVARGSATEVEALFHVCERLGVTDSQNLSAVRQKLNDVQRMLTRLRKRLAEGARTSARK